VEDLASMYQSAFAYVFPSLNEGFGLPVLEAFNASIPLICANNSCLPEVAGDAALYFDPYNVHELSQCMQNLIDDPDMVLALKEKGKHRLNQFSWSKTAITIQTALEKI
jgi:glycosyltransferase involved in cell wall biosynthesis